MTLEEEIFKKSELDNNKLLEYVMHHSKSYGVAYHPHYRIMRRDIFDKEILPYIKEYYITPSLDAK